MNEFSKEMIEAREVCVPPYLLKEVGTPQGKISQFLLLAGFMRGFESHAYWNGKSGKEGCRFHPQCSCQISSSSFF